MMRISFLALTIVAMAGLVFCATSAPSESLAVQATGILRDKCCCCHNHGWKQGEGKHQPWADDVPRMINEKLIVPGKPDESKLFKMGAGGHKGAWKPEDTQVVRQWIEQGAADPNATKATSRTSR